MLGIVYLLICFITGYAICTCVVPEVFSATENTYNNKKINVSPVLVWLPASFITGILLVTWTVYLLGNVFNTSRTPLVAANAIAMIVYAIVSAVLLIWKKNSLKKPKFLCEKKSSWWIEGIFLLLFLLLSIGLMFYTFYVKDGNVYIGYSVYSDFSPHMSMIRSFSYGNNFPTWYPYYTGIDVKYHFMFQFLAGNLEFLGMGIDYAFNIPSIMGLMFTYMLLYVLTVKITGKRAAGVLAAVLFSFRSSESLFTYLAETPKGESIWTKLKDNGDFIGYTTNESWGLWNLNVYANQRHLALCLAVLLLVILLVLPRLYETFALWKEMKQQEENTYKFMDYFKQTFFTKEGWIFGNVKLAVFVGIFAGATAFWNGAALIALILMLFFIAALSRKRLDFVIIAGIAGGLSLLQSNIFMQESNISPEFYFGFIAENTTLFGSVDYILRLIGVLAVVVVAAFMYYTGVKRYLLFVFATPFIFAFTVSLTIDPTVNHKYIMISWMMLDVIVAGFIADIFKKKDIVRRIGGAVLVILLTATGIYDTYSIYQKNGPNRSVCIDLDDPATEWVRENTDSSDVFLTAPYTVNRVTMGGAMLYNGWQYFAWSAGYDTSERDALAAAMFTANTPEELNSLVEECGISYIVVDGDCRAQEAYSVREDVIAATYEAVYTEGTDWDKLTIYDTAMPIY